MDEHQMEGALASLQHIAAALLDLAGVAKAEVDASGLVRVRALTEQEATQRDTPPPPMRVVPGRTQTLMGDGAPISWVLMPPKPYDGVGLVCTPDAESPVGMRCYAEKKLLGGERQRFSVAWKEMP